MKEFSFFKNRRGSLSGLIRADQMAQFFGAKVNPTMGFEQDTCIYVKCNPITPIRAPERTYIDMVDQPAYIPWLLKHFSLGVIVTSKITWEYVSVVLCRKDIILIPQHHCNYLRESRNREEVKVVGIIGSPECEEPNNEQFISKLREIGLELAVCRNPRRREKVVNFYKSIDIQVVYRPHQIENKMLTSLKLANASSFGIPTVACPEMSYVDEFDGLFLPVKSEDELFSEIKRLKEEPVLYEDLSGKAKENTEKYHIENIAKLYRQLL